MFAWHLLDCKSKGKEAILCSERKRGAEVVHFLYLSMAHAACQMPVHWKLDQGFTARAVPSADTRPATHSFAIHRLSEPKRLHMNGLFTSNSILNLNYFKLNLVHHLKATSHYFIAYAPRTRNKMAVSQMTK